MAYTPQSWVDGSSGGTPLSAARLNNMETGIGAAITTVDAKAAFEPKHTINVKDYGATGDGVTNDGPGLQAAFNAASGLGSAVSIPPGNYFTNQDLSLPHGVPVVGGGASKTRIFGNVQRRLKITGDSTRWVTVISGLRLELVGILFGETTSDFGRGTTLRDMEIHSSDVGVEYRNHCWLTRIENCRIWGCVRGVYNNFTGVIDSGASMVIASTVIFNNTGAGFEQASTAADGWHVHITDTDIEHCQTSVKLRSVGDGTLDVTNGHYELNVDSYIDADSGTINVNGGWMFGQQATSVAHFVLSGTARCYLNSGRVAWDSTFKLAKVTGTAQLLVNPNQLRWNRPWGLVDGGFDGDPFATGSARGVALPAGFTVGSKRDPGTLAPGATTIVIQKLSAYDENTYEANLAANVTAVGTAPNRVVIYWNPGGATASIVDLPNVVGVAQLRIVYRYDRARVYWTYSNGVGGMVDTAIGHAITVDKFIELQNGGNSTMTFADWSTRILANTAA